MQSVRHMKAMLTIIATSLILSAFGEPTPTNTTPKAAGISPGDVSAKDALSIARRAGLTRKSTEKRVFNYAYR